MSIPSLIFWIIFVVPLVGFLVWVMRQDRRKGVIGLVILSILVVAAVLYTYLTTGGK